VGWGPILNATPPPRVEKRGEIAFPDAAARAILTVRAVQRSCLEPTPDGQGRDVQPGGDSTRPGRAMAPPSVSQASRSATARRGGGIADCPVVGQS
jgi:hypothetical protein